MKLENVLLISGITLISLSFVLIIAVIPFNLGREFTGYSWIIAFLGGLIGLCGSAIDILENDKRNRLDAIPKVCKEMGATK